MNSIVGFFVGILQAVFSMFSGSVPASTPLGINYQTPPSQQTIMSPQDVVNQYGTLPHGVSTGGMGQTADDASPHAVFPFVGDDSVAKVYRNSQYGFSIEYPSDVQVDTTSAAQRSYTANINNGTKLIVIGPITKSFKANEPDWGDKGVVSSIGRLTVSVSTDAADIAKCMTPPPAGEVGPSNIATKIINGITFLSYDVDQPAAGLLGLDHSYTTLHNGVCYSIDASIDGAESGHMNATDGAANDAVLDGLSKELDSIAQRFFLGSTNETSVPGMSKYTDSDFGFSFWYPDDWLVTPESVQYPNYNGATVVKQLFAGRSSHYDIGISPPSIYLSEIVSSDRSIVFGSGSGLKRYYFDPSIHAWMTQTSSDHNAVGAHWDSASPAEVSTNTMGGLHMLTGPSAYVPYIVPLSANHFLLIQGWSDESTQTTAFIKTITATDSTVATPVSVPDQDTTIQNEKEVYTKVSEQMKFTATPTEGTVPLTVVFTYPYSAGQTIPQVDIIDFKRIAMKCSGQTCTLTYTYTEKGTYYAGLIVGTNNLATETVTVR